MGTRPAAVAGTFYPSSPRRLARTVDDLLDAVDVPAGEPAPVALIVPHAGYRFSGPVAASAYARIRGHPFRRVVALGPAHFVPVDGLAVPSAEAFQTPLGPVPVDTSDLLVDVCDRAHADEHSIEVQLPFLQRALPPGWSLVPIAVGDGPAAPVADAIDEVIDESTLTIVSTDLSHYHEVDTARRLDKATADAVVARDPDALGDGAACGLFALRGLLHWAGRRNLAVRLLDLRNSADTAGDPSRVVGYGAFAADR